MQELEKILEEIDELFVTDIDGLGAIDCNLEGRSGLPCDDCYACLKDVCKDIIRKHMNDGWIPVEEEMPESLQRCLITVLIPDRKAAWSKEKTFARIVDISIYDSDEFNGWDGYRNVIAWRPLPEPYRPEGKENIKQ